MDDQKASDESMTQSIQHMRASLNEQISELNSMLKCRHLKVSQEDREQLEHIESRISTLEADVAVMDESVTREEQALMFMERMCDAAELQSTKLAAMAHHLPDQLPVISDRYQQPSKTHASIIRYARSGGSYEPTLSPPPQTVPPPQHRRALKRKGPSANNQNDKRALKRRRINEKGNSNNRNKGTKSTSPYASAVPQIEIVGKDEFESVPKYVRGRLTQTRLNESILEFNQELTAKYRILQMAPSKLQGSQYDAHDRYLKQETKETKALHWLNHDDFRNSANFTHDQTGKAIFQVMRHLKRIKMLSGKKPKYAVL